MVVQRPGLAIEWIGRGQWHALNILDHLRTFARPSIAQIGPLARWIATHHQQIATVAQVVMAHASRDHNPVARLYGDDCARCAAKLHTSFPPANQQYLVGCAMIMMKPINPIAPSSTPAMPPEDLLGHGGWIGRGKRHHLRIEHKRQGRVVGDRAIINEVMGADCERFCSS